MKTLIGLLVLMIGGLIIPASVSGAPHAYRIRVDGLACPFCTYGIEKRLHQIEGVERTDPDLKAGTVTVIMKEGETLSEEQARKAIQEAGFTLRNFEPAPEPNNPESPPDEKQ